MFPIVYRPHKNFQWKMLLTFGLIAGVVFAFFFLIAAAIGREEGGTAGVLTGMWISIICNAAWILPGFILIPPYYRSLQYEIHEDEVLMRVGVVTKTVKHVPFRTVTNLTVNRGPFDRLFGLGTLKIQTAGMSGQSGAEESLVGLPNFQEVYDQVVKVLRRYRGAMAPTQAEEELALTGDGMMADILTEVRTIRETLTHESET